MSMSRRRALLTLVSIPPMLFGLTSSTTTPQRRRRGGSIRLAMFSFWHVHTQEYEHQALANHATQIMAIWDEVPERGRVQAQALQVPFYDNLPDLLQNAAVDGVIVDTPTTMHRDVMVAAAQAGKHIFTEKVLAPTLHESKQIVTAVTTAGVRLMVSLPRLYSSSTVAIKDILERKLLGEVTKVRVSVSHDGALRTPQHPQGWLPPSFFDPQQTAGGAMIDLGAHPMYLTRLFLGQPEHVSATYGYITGRAVEDNAVVVLHYPRGTVGIVEAGFVNPFSPLMIEVHGTQGSLLYGTPDNSVLIRSAVAGKPASERWSAWTPMPPDQPTAFQQWIMHIQQGTTATENIHIAVDLSALMEAANQSARNKQAVRLDTR